jgi:hypothetical protein
MFMGTTMNKSKPLKTFENAKKEADEYVERICRFTFGTATKEDRKWVRENKVITITRKDFRRAFIKGYSHEDGSTDMTLVEEELFGVK